MEKKEIIKQKLIKDEFAEVLRRIADGSFDAKAARIMAKEQREQRLHELYTKSKFAYAKRFLLCYVCYYVLLVFNAIICGLYAMFRMDDEDFPCFIITGWAVVVIAGLLYLRIGTSYFADTFSAAAEWQWSNFIFGGSLAGSWLHFLIANNTLMAAGAMDMFDPFTEGAEAAYTFGGAGILVFCGCLLSCGGCYLGEYVILQLYWIIITAVIFLLFSPVENAWKKSAAEHWLEKLKKQRG